MSLRDEAGPGHRADQCGLSLIELMIGMVLGLVILGAVLYLFAGNRASHRHQESLSMVQESGRFALERLSQDVRMAGYAGCGNTAFVGFLGGGGFDNTNVLVGVEGADLLTPDSFTFWRGFGGLARVVSNPNSTQINVDDGSLLDPAAGFVLITDCVFAEVVNLAGVAGNTVTVGALQRTYGAGAQVMAFEAVNYAVGIGNVLQRNALPIAEGVANMKVLYGVDTTGNRNADIYVGNPTLAQRPNIVSARVTLTAQDRDVTLPFTTTVALRNRVP